MATLTIVQKLDLGFGFLFFFGFGFFFLLLILVIELKFLLKKRNLKEKFKNLRSPPVVLGSLPLLHLALGGSFLLSVTRSTSW